MRLPIFITVGTGSKRDVECKVKRNGNNKNTNTEILNDVSR